MLRFILHCKALNSLGAQPSPVAVTQGTRYRWHHLQKLLLARHAYGKHFILRLLPFEFEDLQLTSKFCQEKLRDFWQDIQLEFFIYYLQRHLNTGHFYERQRERRSRQ